MSQGCVSAALSDAMRNARRFRRAELTIRSVLQDRFRGCAHLSEDGAVPAAIQGASAPSRPSLLSLSLPLFHERRMTQGCVSAALSDAMRNARRFRRAELTIRSVLQDRFRALVVARTWRSARARGVRAVVSRCERLLALGDQVFLTVTSSI